MTIKASKILGNESSISFKRMTDVYKRQGLDYVALGRQTGQMAAKVLKGEAKASEMNFEVIKGASFYGNTKVAENLGITLPESLTANAAEMFDEITQ